MKIAKKFRDIHGWRGEAAVYMLTPAFDGHDLVIVSAVQNVFGMGRPETMVFPCTIESLENDQPINWSELWCIHECSQEACLTEMGYTIEQDVRETSTDDLKKALEVEDL